MAINVRPAEIVTQSLMVGDVLHFAIVRISVWMAVAAWFLGLSSLIASHRRLTAGCWMFGACLLVTHIVGSYGLVHHWSHQAALEATRQKSLAVTGVTAGWGVYVNFAFAIIWLAHAVSVGLGISTDNSRPHMEKCRDLGGLSHFSWFDAIALAFQALIVFSATVIFEAGPIRWLSIGAFLVITIQAVSVRLSSIQKRSSEG